MRHHVANRKLQRETGQRRALLRSLAANLILRGRITTTEAKAKEVRKFVEPLITTARQGTVTSRRLVAARLGTTTRTKKLCDDIAPKYKDRTGGYTRIVKIGRRPGDHSPMALIEFV